MEFRKFLLLLFVPLISAAHPGADPYHRAMLKAERRASAGQGWDADSFNKLDWIGRTAVLNRSCQPSQEESACRNALQLGLGDSALLVRDHALRLALHGPVFSAEKKRELARQALADQRNYRQGFGLWIVERAKEQLAVP